MWRLLFPPLAVLLALACPLLAAVEVPNAGFEVANGDMPAAWDFGLGEAGRGQGVWVTTGGHSGPHCFRVTKQGAVGYAQLVSDFVPVEPGKAYRVTAWVKPTQTVRRGVYFMITQHTADSPADQYPNSFSNTNQVLVAGQWQLLTHTVEIRPGNTRLRIHCLQAFTPSEICWDDFTVSADTAPEPYQPLYEPPTPEPVPPLDDALRAVVAQRPRAQARLVMAGERPRLLVDGKLTPFAWYVGPFGADFPQRAQIGDFARAGVHVYLVPLVLGHGQYGDRGPWLGKGQWDFREVDDLLWRVLRSDPQGYVVFYMACDPYPAWGQENPEDITRDQDGLPAIVSMHPKRWGNDPGPGERFGPSALSPKFRADVAETLRQLAAYVEAGEPGKAVIGYHVAGLNDGQWFPWEKLTPNDLHLSDYSPGAQRGFRAWLRTRYADVARLRAAWHDPQVTFDTASIPPGDQLWLDKVFLSPATDQRLMDWHRFYSEGVAETVEYLAGVLKQATPRPILCGTYYEDITCNSAAHIALARHLASKEIDYLAGPAAYAIRLPGNQGAVRNVFGSTLLHGKMYLTEQDWRSWHSEPVRPDYDVSVGRALTAAAHNAMVRRECGMMLAFGIGTWWYDMSGGWFRDDGIMAGIAEAVRAFRRELTLRQAPQADVALFVSEESNYALSPRYASMYRWSGITKQIEEFNTAGVPYRLYLQSDLGRAKLPDHKLYVFLNPYALDDVQRQALAGLKRDGKTLVFIQAPGVIGAADPAAAVGAVTGMKMAAVPQADQLIPLAEATAPLLQACNSEISLGGVLPGTYFAVDDPQATPLARYGESGPVGCALRDFGAWRSVFVGVPGLSPAFLNALARYAGAWTAASAGDAVYASQNFVTIHAMTPGEKTLTLKTPARVTDLCSGQVVAEQTGVLRLTMSLGETRWFYLEPR